MKSLNVTQARKDIYRLIESVHNRHEPVQITGKNNNIVLVSEEDWKSVNETLYLLSIQGMRQSIVEGMATPVDECAEKLSGDFKVYTKDALKDAKKLSRSKLKGNVTDLLDILQENPYRTPPPYEKLIGDLSVLFQGELTYNIALFIGLRSEIVK